MSKKLTQWATDTVNANVTGVTLRGGGAPTYKVQYGTPPVKRRYLEWKTDTTTVTADKCVSYNAVDADANRDKFDILTIIDFSVSGVNVHHFLYGRGQGTATITDGYRCNFNTTVVSLDKYVTSVRTQIGTVTFGAALSSTGKYFLRFRGNGTTLQVKQWLVGSAEPATWDLTVADASVTAAGWVGQGAGSTAIGDVSAQNFISVGTNGDVAQTPLLNTEYTAWLGSQRKRRCVLAEFSGTGYDPTVGSPNTKTVNMYVSNMGYTSKDWDSPSSRHYDNLIKRIPTFDREMGAALSGQVAVNFGNLVLRNNAQKRTLTRATGVTFDATHKASLGSINVATTFTFETWVTVNSVSSISALFSNSGIEVDIGGGTINLLNAAFAEVDSTTQVKIGVPQHIAVAYDGVNASFYINGVAAGTLAFSYTSSTSAGFLGSGAVNAFNCLASMGEARLWSLARTAAQIKSMYNFRAVGNETGLVGLWHFDEGQGTTVADGSAGGHPATLTAGTVWGNVGRALPATKAGIMDDLLRIHWNRNYLNMWLGDPSWPRHDFRQIVMGRIGTPSAPNTDEIQFPIADLGDIFNNALQSAVFSTGDYAGQFKPLLLGQMGDRTHPAGKIEPPLTDSVNNVFTLSDTQINVTDPSSLYGKVFGNELEIKTIAGLSVTAVNAATDVITSAAHGMGVDWRVQFTGGTPPAPLSTSTDYWVVAANLTGTTFSLAATKGGAAINITGTTTGSGFTGYAYTFDEVNATVTVATNIVGLRITVQNIGSLAVSSDGPGMLNEIATRAGLSANNIGTLAGTSWIAGLWYDTKPHTCAEAVLTVAKGLFMGVGFTFDGLFSSWAIDLPASTAKISLGEYHTKPGSLLLTDVIRPIDFSKTFPSYAPWFLTQGPLPTGTPAAKQGKSYLSAASYGASSIPLDNYPSLSDPDTTTQFDFLGYIITPRYHETVFKRRLGIFEVYCRLAALEANIGDTISLSHSRLGWKVFSGADPASPDNLATIDSTLAVVVGHAVNLGANDPFMVKLKLMRVIPGLYPLKDIN